MSDGAAEGQSDETAFLTGPVALELSNTEALVLFEFLARGADERPEAYRIEHQSEQRVLWDLQAMLESKLIEPLRPEYGALLERAREEVQDPETEP